MKTPAFTIAALAAFAVTSAAAAPAARKPASRSAPRSAAAAAPRQILPMPLRLVVEPALRGCKQLAPSGLGYSVLRAATGAQPAADGSAVVRYIGYLRTTGEVFDQSEEPVTMSLGRVIPGFSQGLGMMQKGSIYRFCLPAKIAYGAKAIGPIPANSDLVFQVELIDIKPAGQN